jgi:hypothetical protein
MALVHEVFWAVESPPYGRAPDQFARAPTIESSTKMPMMTP